LDDGEDRIPIVVTSVLQYVLDDVIAILIVQQGAVRVVNLIEQL
jgi:hypothetical protein